MRTLIAVTLLLLPALASAQEFKMEPGPKSPEESLKCIKPRPGFKVELMVSEPLVLSPIAFAWGPDGKFWVVEMGDYPLGIDGKGKPGGRIKYLEKSKADGPYDKMTVFMDGLGFPTGVLPYGKGVLVTCAPDIFYAEMGKDGKVKKEVLFTGFNEGNQQHRVNGLSWGIDNWIYGANGDSGGKVKSLKTGQVVDIRGRDFRLKPDTGEFEAQSGQSQYGRCRDDWGNWFGNNNSNPMFHYVLDDHYLRRNPHVLYPDPRVMVSVKPGASEIFPISKPLPRFNSPQALNHFTSACSTIIYRDTLFGKDFTGNMFVSEPVHNLIHREIMKPKGVTFTSQRADDEQQSEFLASSDNWFRPTMIQTGPDGALWVADMYRYVIEHPEWIPKDWQKKLDLRAGHDKGRIYRVYPADKKPREIPRMDELSVKELVSALESPNGWVRDTAQQVLIKKYSAASTEEKTNLAKTIAALVTTTKVPQARLHALYIFSATTYANVFIQPHVLDKLMADPHPAVRKHAIALTGEDYQMNAEEKLLGTLEKDEDAQVRQQLAYSLGRAPSRKYHARLARVLIADANEKYILAAALSSISDKNWKDIYDELMTEKSLPVPLFLPLTKLVKVYSNEPTDLSRLLVRQLYSNESLPKMERINHVSALLDGVDTSGLTLKEMLKSLIADGNDKTLQRVKQTYAEGVQIMENPTSSKDEKMKAMRLLARGLGSDKNDHKLLVSFLTPTTADDVQAAVIQQLTRDGDPRAVHLLLAPWKGYSPKLRGQVLDLLLSRTLWARLTLDALAKKEIPASEIDAIRRQRLLLHKDEAVREAARKVFAAASSSNRGQLVDEYWLRLPDKGDRARGEKLFAKSCATCHQSGYVGVRVGPDLASVGDKSPQGLLIAILDPNRAVETRYISYVAVTKKGLSFNGIITSETSTSITLTGPDGKQQQLLRNELDELGSTGKSLMPEGLEKDLSPQDLADLIEYVRGNVAAPKRKEFPGNQPETVAPDKEGVLLLTPKTAAIFGPKIVIEKQYGNLGFWGSPEDHIVWKFTTAKEASYEVWLEYACADFSAGNKLQTKVGATLIQYKVIGTGTWDLYQSSKVGYLILPAGTHEITLRSEGNIRGALIDLKGVKLVPKK